MQALALTRGATNTAKVQLYLGCRGRLAQGCSDMLGDRLLRFASSRYRSRVALHWGGLVTLQLHARNLQGKHDECETRHAMFACFAMLFKACTLLTSQHVHASLGASVI